LRQVGRRKRGDAQRTKAMPAEPNSSILASTTARTAVNARPERLGQGWPPNLGDGGHAVRTRIFIDFWNFQLHWNDRLDPQRCDWRALPPA